MCILRWVAAIAFEDENYLLGQTLVSKLLLEQKQIEVILLVFLPVNELTKIVGKYCCDFKPPPLSYLSPFFS